MLIIDEDEYIFSPNFGMFFCRGYNGYIPTDMLMKIKTPMCFVDQTDDKYRFIDYTGWSYFFGKTINTIDIIANVHNMDRCTRYYTTNQFKQSNAETSTAKMGELFQQMTKNQKITIYYFFQDVGGGGGVCLFLDAVDYGSNTKKNSSSDVKRNNDDYEIFFFFLVNFEKRYENFERNWEEKSHSSEKKTSNNSNNDRDEKRYENNTSKESSPPNEKVSNCCNLLGLKWPFTIEQLKIAYRESAKMNHPDSSGHNTEELMKQINEAYEYLTDYATT
jgi:curved DNA-binding protein CbpA